MLKNDDLASDQAAQGEMLDVSEEENNLIVSEVSKDPQRSYLTCRIVDLLRSWDGADPSRDLTKRYDEPVNVLRKDLAEFSRRQIALDNCAWSIFSPQFKDLRIAALQRKIAWHEKYFEQENNKLATPVKSVQENVSWQACREEIDFFLSERGRQISYLEEERDQIDEIFRPIFGWLIKDQSFNDAIELFDRKRCTRRLPGCIEVEGFLIGPHQAFTKVAADALLRRIRPYRRKKRKNPSRKLVELAKKLLIEIKKEGLDGYGMRQIEAIADGGQGMIRVDEGHDETRRRIVDRIGRSFYDAFIFESASKGRPYPDVVALLLKMTGFEMSERHINRTLQSLDWIGSMPDMPQWVLENRVMTGQYEK